MTVGHWPSPATSHLSRWAVGRPIIAIQCHLEGLISGALTEAEVKQRGHIL